MDGLFGTSLRLMPKEGLRSLAVALFAGLAFGAYMALSDATVFASVVLPAQHEWVAQTSLAQRLVVRAVGSGIDEIKFRLIAFTALFWLLGLLHWSDRDRVRLVIPVVALLVYPLGTLGYFETLDWSVLVALREVALHGAAGVLWGWLYWRHGWIAGLTGHISAHLALQPLLGII